MKPTKFANITTQINRENWTPFFASFLSRNPLQNRDFLIDKSNKTKQNLKDKSFFKKQQ
jgi:hypothetical protein